ncbi:MAG TPA: PKD domain-containing protein [Candidatus Angelobacter sp.]|nr:PKD domain-containing protein [Candidatus Angelobacter sp.]
MTIGKAILLASILIPSFIIAGLNAAHAGSPPIAAFSWVPCVTCLVVGSLFFFNAGASLGTSGSIILYAWNFGDGSALLQTTNPLVNHDYLSGCATPCLVTLTVKDSSGLTDTIGQTILFDTVPIIEFQPPNPSIGLPVTFNGTGSISYSPTNPILGYSWNFGDGSSATGKIVTHTYTFAGPYRIILTLMTAQGNPSASSTIKVSGATPVTLLKTTFNGINVTASGSLAINATAKTLAGSESVTAVNATSGAVIFSKTFSFTVSFGSTANIKFVLKLPVTSLALGVDCTINSSTASASCIVSRNPDVNGNGTVSFLDVSTMAIAYGSTLGSPRYNPAVDLNADGAVDFIDASITTFYFGAPVIG